LSSTKKIQDKCLVAQDWQDFRTNEKERIEGDGPSIP